MSEKHPKESATDWARIDRLNDEEIDTTGIPPLDDEFFAKAQWRMPKVATDISTDEERTMRAVGLYRAGHASLGQAAKLAGHSKRAFIEVLARHQIPVFNYSPDELREELGL